MVFKFLKQRWQRIVVIVLFSIALLIFLLAFFVNIYWSPILANKLKDVVSKSSDGLYTVEFSDAELHVIRGTIVIYNIVLKPDTAVYNREKLQHLAPNTLIELHIKKLTLNRVHPMRLYFKHKVEVDNLTINEPEISIQYQLNHKKDTVLKDKRTPWQKISKTLKSIHIGNILLGDVKFKYRDYSGNKVAISELKEMNLSANDLLIDSTTQYDKSRLLFCKDIVAQLNNYSANTANGLYSYKINSLTLSTKKSLLLIQGISLKPIRPDLFFEKTLTDRFTLHMDTLQLNHFDFLSYAKYRVLDASSLAINGASMQLFGSPKSNPNDKADKIRGFPNEALSELKAELNIDTILLRQLNVTYSEYNAKSQKTGSITFINTNARFLNVTTNKAALQKNNFSTVSITSYFMNRAKLTADFKFNLTDADRSFDYKGAVGPLDLKELNKVLMPLVMVKVNSGREEKMDFNIHANRYGSKGAVNVLYNNLKVTILKADTDLNQLNIRPIESLFANIFILKHDNPDKPGKVPRAYIVTYTRKPEVPFFKSIWQTLLSGIKPVIGLDEKTTQATKAMIAQRKVNKADRKVKKALRIQHREERKQKREQKKLAKEREKEKGKLTP